MDLDGLLGSAKFSGDLFVQEASNDQSEDLAFAWRQRLIPSLQLGVVLVVDLAVWQRAMPWSIASSNC